MNETGHLGNIKIRIYQRTLSIASPVILLVWMLSEINNASSGIDSFTYPFFAFFSVSSLLLFRKYNARYLDVFENIGFGFVFIYFVAQFASETQLGIDTSSLGFRKFLLWIAILYTFAFLVFPPRRALYWSSLYIVAIVIIGIYYFIRSVDSPNLGTDAMILLQIYGSGLTYVSLLFAIAELKKKYTEAEIRSQTMSTLANTDILTGALSRRKIEEHLNAYIDNIGLSKKPFSVMVIDLDKLKLINDTLGHNAGDYALQRTVDLLSLKLRSGDCLGRIGGDEFLVLCPNSDPDAAELLAQRLEKSISNADFNNIGNLTVSIGHTTYQKGDTPQTLISRADKNMYVHKRSKTRHLEKLGI